VDRRFQFCHVEQLAHVRLLGPQDRRHGERRPLHFARFVDLKGKLSAPRASARFPISLPLCAEKNGLNPSATSLWCRPVATRRPCSLSLTGKSARGGALRAGDLAGQERRTCASCSTWQNWKATIHQNGVVTTRKYLKTNEDTVRRFLRAYIEGAVLAKKDKAFATRVMAKLSRHQRSRDCSTTPMSALRFTSRCRRIRPSKVSRCC